MNKYIPFLKAKRNEIQAVKALDKALRRNLVVFFEIPRLPEDAPPSEYQKAIDKAAAAIQTNCSDVKEVYVDVFDVPASISIGTQGIYAYTLQVFGSCRVRPVVGIDRSVAHNEAALAIKPEIVCLRVQLPDAASFEVFCSQFDDENGLSELGDMPVDLVVDCRYCGNCNAAATSKQIGDFLTEAKRALSLRRTVIVGSSIPASIRDVCETEDEVKLPRKELVIFREVASRIGNRELFFGDYTVVSPLFVDVEMRPEMWQNVLAPKLVYSTEGIHYIQRGGALKTHPQGNKQYNNQCAILAAKDFYRGADYSWGDSFIDEKSRYAGSNVTPSTVIKPTVNAHITYMLRG